MSKEKLITFTMISEGGNWIVDQEAKNLLDIVFGCNKDGKINAETIDDLFPDLEDDEEYTFTFKVQRVHTQKELDDMPESDGDIH